MIAGTISCKKDPVGTLNTGNYTDTAGTLQQAATPDGIIFGLESDFPTVTTNSTYLATIAREASYTTFGYEMKHGAIVQNDGSFNYTNTDEQFNTVTNAGLQVFGHNLCWYQNQNATYLNSIAGAGSGSSAPNLIVNGNFEAGSGTNITGWSVYNQSNGSFSLTTSNAYAGSQALQATITAAGSNYNTQIASTGFTAIVGHQYTVTFFIKAANPGGSEQVEVQYGGPSVNYSGNMNNTTSWTQVTWSFTANGPNAILLFDMGLVANTYYIDNVSVVDATAAAANSAPTAVASRVDSVLQLWISGPNGIVTRYAGKVKAWDVVNEPMSDGTGALRTNTNTTIPTPEPSDWFFWSEYMGRTYALKAFQYAKAADPNALLFINEYNLESNTAKLDSLIGYVKELQGEGAKIDGIGTEMHITINTSYAGIDAAFQALAATGLKVRISELDVRLNPTNKTGFNTLPIDPTTLAYQANMYEYVVNSYLKNVPAAQRYGITVWGVDDPQSWIITSEGFQDAPLLFNGTFGKKPAYAGVIQGLKGK